jgi:uncharacterized protein
MIRRTFQLAPGIGPWKEKDLWASGLAGWDALLGAGGKLADKVRGRIELAQAALEGRELATLAGLFPAREHWRLYREFAEEAVFFDIETDGVSDRITVVSLFDAGGLRLFVADRNLQGLAEALAERRVWVTFNGSCFDVPVIRRAFPKLPQPALHLDLRFILRRLGHGGGLKAIERAFGLLRAHHLQGVDGWDAVLLWRAYQQSGDLEALRCLVEYNLYDAFNLRTLMDHAYNLGVDRLALTDEPKVPVFERGDILFDVSRLLLGLGPEPSHHTALARARAGGIT